LYASTARPFPARAGSRNVLIGVVKFHVLYRFPCSMYGRIL
jgi:hypothetical protein